MDKGSDLNRWRRLEWVEQVRPRARLFSGGERTRREGSAQKNHSSDLNLDRRSIVRSDHPLRFPPTFNLGPCTLHFHFQGWSKYQNNWTQIFFCAS